MPTLRPAGIARSWRTRGGWPDVATTKRIFIGFAVEDKQYRDLMRGQSKLGDSPIDYTDMSVKQPWDGSWKTKCRQRIKDCEGFIALSRFGRKFEGPRRTP